MGQVHVSGVKVGHHWWNRLPDGSTVDLTAEQFLPGETVTGGEFRHRPPDAPRRCRGQYALLRHRVHRALADEHPALAAIVPVPLGTTDPSIPAVQIAVVALTDRTGAVLLQLRSPEATAEPGQWALPGGYLEHGETPAQAAVRELAELTGLAAQVHPIWHDLRPDLTGSAPYLELHAFTGTAPQTTVAINEGRAARFIPVVDLPNLDLSPTAAAVLHVLSAASSAHDVGSTVSRSSRKHGREVAPPAA